MKVLFIVLIILILLALAVAIGTYQFTFVHKMKDHVDASVMTDFDKGYYGEFTDEMAASGKRMTETEHKHVYIKSDDGLKLNGHLYDSFPGRPLMIFCHGYHGTYLRDGYGSFRYCMSHNINLLMIEQRAHCKSEGDKISFGVNERKDLVKWVEYAKSIMPADTKIILSGVSMGAATVMMASDLLDSDPQVLCFIEDCGYTSPKEIICNTAKNMHFPVELCYPLARMAAKILGGFDVESSAAIESVSKISKPMLFVHGDKDGFVPPEMCNRLFRACSSENKVIKYLKDADHAIAALVKYDEYEETVDSFLNGLI